MMEWKRTIFSGRFLCLLLCIILLNGIFFLKVQFDRNLGLDLSAPESQLSHSVIVTEEGFSQSEKLPQISLNELNKEYLTVLNELKSLSLQRNRLHANRENGATIPVMGWLHTLYETKK